MRTASSFAALLCALALSACDTAGETTPSPAAPANAASTDDPPWAPQAQLRLAADGLDADGPGTEIAFGMPRAAAVAAVAASLGQPTDHGANQECGAGPMEFVEFGPLALNFQNGAFVGWFHSAPARTPPLRTATRLGIGTPRDQIMGEGQGPLQVSETSLGTQFDAAGINGLLSGPEPDAAVTSLWTGINCIFH